MPKTRYTQSRDLFLPMIALAFFVGCSENKKNHECVDLVKVVNAAVERVEGAAVEEKKAQTSGGELKALAGSMDLLDKAAERLQLTERELKRIRQQYRKLSRDVAAAARALSLAIENADAEKKIVAQKQMDEAVKPEQSLVDGLNRFCQVR